MRTRQISYARGLISREEQARVMDIMQRFRLPMWHPVCGPDLLLKVALTVHKCHPYPDANFV